LKFETQVLVFLDKSLKGRNRERKQAHSHRGFPRLSVAAAVRGPPEINDHHFSSYRFTMCIVTLAVVSKNLISTLLPTHKKCRPTCFFKKCWLATYL